MGILKTKLFKYDRIIPLNYHKKFSHKNIKLGVTKQIIMFESWNTNISYEVIASGIIFILAILLRKLFARVILKQLRNIVKNTQTKIDDKVFNALETPLKFIFIILAFYIITVVLNLTPDINKFFTQLFNSLIVFTIFWSIYRCVEPFSFIINDITDAFGAELTHALKNLFIKGLKIFILLMGLTAFLNEWGINIFALLASLSIAGAAVAFAAKDSLANIFGSFTIIFDKIFKQGDWIMTSEIEGTVEEVGSRATKIRTFSKAVVTIPNATLANSAVINWSRMTSRRIKMRIGLEYRTSPKQVTNIIKNIKTYLQNNSDIETDPSKAVILVHLTEFNESSIDILVYYFTKTTSWQNWMRIKEHNLLKFMEIIEEEGASFAFPSQQIYVEKLPDDLPKMI
ncbi:MAG TPA: mechanosensitive ion channel family protein [Thioploca sp.]|nr:mechanosensitive ion channel family protein [Thioploca sp.]